MNDFEQLLLEFQINSALLTTISWTRMSLVSQESTEIMYKGIANNSDITQNFQFNLNATFKKPLHDDLDLFFHGIRKQGPPNNEHLCSMFECSFMFGEHSNTRTWV